MNTANLKTFAQYARRYLKEQISGKIQHVLSTDSAVQRENPKAVAELKKKIANTSTGQVIDKVAYIWFNRFCALRFLDVNRYNRMGILSPAEGQSQPEILAEAKMGHIDEVMVPEAVRRRVVTLLNGSTPSPDPQGEAYRLLLVAACNDCHKTMPYMFEKIADYTELLMPDDLLSDNSILSYIRETMTPEACEDVEVIGWLYQYYISEKKDEVFDGLKKGIKIMPENIPAATQLFTPHWIVRYLVENSVGRLWLLNRPHSKLADRMDYYIKPEQPETDFLKIGSPEELKICDPACGSGHMLTYAFDLLYFIYEEEGYSSAEIPTKILTHNLYGIEIDERAGSLASFALAMKARAQNRGFFRQRVSPNICVLETVQFETGEIQTYIDAVGRTLFTNSMKTTLRQFEEADNFGSLIRPDLKNAADILQLITSINLNNNLFLQVTHEKVLKVFRQVDYLCPKYEVVIANPPYMSSNGMNNRLKTWAESNFANSKTDLFAMFIERNLDLVRKYGLVAMITMQGWMFLSSFEKLRKVLLSNSTILSMAHLGERAFDSIGGVVVSTSAYVIQNACHNTHKAEYLRLVDGNSEIAKATATKEAIENPDCGWFFRTSIDDIKKIPEWPIAYWLSAAIRGAYNDTKIGEKYEVKEGLGTRDDSRFLRYYWEVGFKNIRMDYQAHEKWVPVDKAGGYRKWFGSNYTVMNWFDDGYEIRNFEKSVPRNIQYFFRPAVSWGKVSTGRPSFRYRSDLFAFVDAAPSAFSGNLELLIAALNSNAMSKFLKIQGDTVNVTVGAAKNLPLPSDVKCDPALKCIQLARNDWNAYETSWDFTKLDLLCPKYRQATLAKSYSCLRQYWRNITVVMQSLEEENNRNFIEAYGLRDELTSEVPFKEITLTCNPHYRYGNDKTEAELEALLLTDTMIEFISYAVGCMFGRYALEKPGLILANQGETLEDYLRQIPEPSFPADQDNVIPIIEGDWFAEDIAARFRRFLRLTFGEEKFAENLRFIEEAIGKDIAKYFAKDFYNDHLKRYKKRPIYWLFSSPKGSFNALIYMHRYRPDTVSIILNDYLREYRTKLSARKAHMEQVSISGSVSVSEKTKALKEIENLKKVLDELMQYERDVIYPLAAQKLEIDLDDGVKVNYLKFGAALRKIPGLDAGKNNGGDKMENAIAQALGKMFERHRIVFWYDAKQELRAEFDALQLPAVTKIELQNNEFGIKYRILRQQPTDKFLLYKEGPQPLDLENWLLDVQLAGETFRTDQVALWLGELSLGPEYAELLKMHEEFFRAVKRKEALQRSLATEDSERIIRLKMIAVCAGAEPTLEAVLEHLLAELAEGRDEKFRLICRCNLDAFLWEQLKRVYGYVSNVPGLRDFVISLFKSCYAMGTNGTGHMNGDSLVFLRNWKDSRQHAEAFETLSGECAEALNIERDLEKRDFRSLLALDYFRLIDQKIISELVQAVAARTVSAGDVVQWVRQRRQGRWYTEFCDLYEAVDAAAQFIAALDTVQLTMDSLADGVERYARSWFRLDQLYRQFVCPMRRASNASLLGPLAERVENLYVNNYLLKLNDQWQGFVDSAVTWSAPPVQRQDAFFRQWVQPILKKDNKIYVIISDALRYEIGEELLGLIRQEDRFEAELEPMLAMLPSYTQLGMAALLPNSNLALADGDSGSVLVDGESSQGTVNRLKILSQAVSPRRAMALRADEVLSFNKEECRALVRDYDVVYVYHNRIDVVGDKRETEDHVFEAAAETMRELVRLVKKLVAANASNLLITADHGFLYQHRPIEESDFSGSEVVGAEILYRDRRFVLGKGLRDDAGLKKYSATALGLTGPLEVQIPKSINRLRRQGSGSRYVHGGAALQEVVTPVLRISKKRQSDVVPVEVEILRGASSMITSGQLGVTFYQALAVTEKIQPRQLRAGIYSLTGELISDRHQLKFDMDSENPRQREVSVRFVLSRKADESNGQEVLLRLEEKVGETSHYREYKSLPYVIRRSFTSDFDF